MNSTAKIHRPKLNVGYKITQHMLNDLSQAFDDLENLLKQDTEPRSECLMLGLAFGVLQVRNSIEAAISDVRQQQADCDAVGESIAKRWEAVA